MAASKYALHVGGRQRRHPLTLGEYDGRRKEFAACGQSLPQSKLLDIDIIDIRSAHRQRVKLLQYIRDNLSNQALAKKHGLHVRNIEKIVTYNTWGHVA